MMFRIDNYLNKKKNQFFKVKFRGDKWTITKFLMFFSEKNQQWF